MSVKFRVDSPSTYDRIGVQGDKPMSPGWKAKILARRAGFLVAAVGATVPASGCKGKVEVVVDEPMTCLSISSPGPHAKGEGVEPLYFSLKSRFKHFGGGRVETKVNGWWQSANATFLKKAESCLPAIVERNEKASGTLEQTWEIINGNAKSIDVTTTGEVSETLRDCIVEKTSGPTNSEKVTMKGSTYWSFSINDE